MKSNSKAFQPLHWLLGLSAAALLAAPVQTWGQADDYNDGNDTGWTRFDPRGGLGAGPQAAFSFPDGGYRIQTPVTPPLNGAGPGRAGSIRGDVTYTDFYVSVDLVAWDDTTRQAGGILARCSTPGLGTLNCYAFTWERGGGVTETSGDLDISLVIGEDPNGLPTEDSSYHLDPTKDYRLVFIGRGPMLEGRVYELPNILEPVKVIITQDSTYTSGTCGLVTFDNDGGMGVTDCTFDNYFASRAEPPRMFVNYNPDFDEVTVSWRANVGPFRLQSTGDLNPTILWTDIPEGQIFTAGDMLQYSTGPETPFELTG